MQGKIQVIYVIAAEDAAKVVRKQQKQPSQAIHLLHSKPSKKVIAHLLHAPSDTSYITKV
jgi:hypothetical protein